MQKIITDIPKNARETLRIELTEYRDHHLVSLRVWVPKSETGELVPTAKGINIAIRLLPAIRDGLAKAEREAHIAGLLTDEKAGT